jgi:uncharacterized membrane protein HdeD (DUF308 family)
MKPSLEKKNNSIQSHRLAAGILLILLGLTVLLQQWFDVSSFAILLLGWAMLAWGSFSHRSGWIIAGGVLSGIGLGILAMEGPWNFPAEQQSGIFLLCFAMGWFLITLLTAIFTCAQWWALIPGGIMAVIGGSILVTRGAVRWQDLNLVYAPTLIFVGAFLLVYKGRSRKNGR